MSSWYLVQNAVRYGDPLARTATACYLGILGGVGVFLVPYHVSDPLHLVLIDVPESIVKTLWYRSGWNQFGWPWSLDVAIAVVVVALAVSALTRRIVPAQTRGALGALVLGGLVSVWVLAFQTSTYRGRYALVALAAVAIWLAIGLERWRFALRWVLPGLALAGCLVALSLDVFGVN